MDFIVFPAIDLRAGKVVRLRQGNPKRQKEYSDNPGDTARHWLEAGAKWLHMVNLDGAFGNASQSNVGALEEILTISQEFDPIPAVQFGGGLRQRDQIAGALALGVRRVIIGTLAVESPQMLAQILEEFGPDRISVGIDARDGQVMTRGWAKKSAMTVLELGTNLRSIGLTEVIFTDVSRDGMGSGLNIPTARELSDHSGLNVIASGGVDSLEDVRAAKNSGLAGVIIGRALYEGHFTLQEALRC